MTPSSATHGPQFEYGKGAGRRCSMSPAKLTSMKPAVSQVSRSTKTRLRFLRRLLLLAIFLVVAALALSQFTELKRLATGILASTAVLGLIVGFAAQHTIANMVAGVQLAVSQPFRIGDRIGFEETEGRVTDITLSYTYVDPGDGSKVVIPNQLLVEGVVHNHSTDDTQA
jgi:small-conductance mechanosensitive channel